MQDESKIQPPEGSKTNPSPREESKTSSHPRDASASSPLPSVDQSLAWLQRAVSDSTAVGRRALDEIRRDVPKPVADALAAYGRGGALASTEQFAHVIAEEMRAYRTDATAFATDLAESRTREIVKPGDDPKRGLGTSQSFESSKSIGEVVGDRNGKIDDIEVVNVGNKTWGYVYHATDGQVYVQRDPASQAQVSLSAGNAGLSLPNQAATVPLTQLSQLPFGARIEPAPLTRDGKDMPAFLPEEPFRNYEASIASHGNVRLDEILPVTQKIMQGAAPITHLEPDVPKPTADWPIVGMTDSSNIQARLGNPAVGSSVTITPNGTRTEPDRLRSIERA